MLLRLSAAFSGCCWIVFAGAERLRWRVAMSLEGRRVLFISYNGMRGPLGQSQVLPYLRELAQRGVRFTLLSFERARAFEPEGVLQCQELREKINTQNN